MPMGLRRYAGPTRFGRMAENRISGGQDFPIPYAIKVPIMLLWVMWTPLLGPPAVSCPGHDCPFLPPLGVRESPKPRSWRYQYVPSPGSCSDVSSLKIEFQMRGFIRGSLKLAPFLTCAHGADGGGVGNSLGYRICCQILGGAEESPSPTGLDPLGMVSLLCPKKPPQQTASTEAQVRQAGAAEKREVGPGCLLSLPSLGGIYELLRSQPSTRAGSCEFIILTARSKLCGARARDG